MTSNGEIRLDYDQANPSPWLRLSTARLKRFYMGVLLRFKTHDCGPRGYQYALAVSYDGARQLSFVDLEGGSWGYGRAQLPEESNFGLEPYTIDVKWLKRNLHYICKVDDFRDVWYCRDFLPIPVKFE